MRRRTRLKALAVGLTTGLLLAWPGTASAADTTPPSLSVVPHALFVQGGVISPSAAPTPDHETFVASIPMYIRGRHPTRAASAVTTSRPSTPAAIRKR